MGECIVVGRGGGQQDQIPVIATACSILITLTDTYGTILPGMTVACKDGAYSYNYTTNDAGKVLFMCNSGSANISVSNKLGNGVLIADYQQTLLNIDSPIGTIKKHTLAMQAYSNGQRITLGSNGNYVFMSVSNVDLHLIGGGGGGSGGYHEPGLTDGRGGAGGSGIIKKNIIPEYNTVYRLIVGDGGAGGTSGRYAYNATVGSSGGSTTFLGVTAVGGNGNGDGNNSGSGGRCSYQGGPENGGSHSVGGGGGGCGGRGLGGSPGGGYGSSTNGGNGSSGGGGAGSQHAYQAPTPDAYRGGRGGTGVAYVTLRYF